MDTRIIKISSIIQTQPDSDIPQGLYLNCVIKVKTGLSPYELLKRLQRIEVDLGRVRAMKNGPRTIDLDILVYGDTRMKERSLCLPHPRMLKREFVMKPLSEIAPGVAKRLKGKTTAQTGLKR